METSAVVMTLTVFLTEAIKRFLIKKSGNEEKAKFWSPFTAIIFGAMLNLGLVLLLQVTDFNEFWSSFQWRETIKEGINIGLQAGGLYGVGKVVVNRANININNKQNW